MNLKKEQEHKLLGRKSLIYEIEHAGQATPTKKEIKETVASTTGTPAEKIKAIEDGGRALKSRIPVIASFEWGTDISPEKLAQGFTHCFFVTFKNTADRDAYLPHQAHKEFIELIKPHLDKVLVVDYVAQD